MKAAKSIFKLKQVISGNSRISAGFSLPYSGRVKIDLYSVSGEEMACVADDNFTAGNHRISWNARGMSAGCYILRMQAAGGTQMTSVHLFR